MAKRDTMRLLRNISGESPKTNLSYQHNEFLKVIIEQQEQQVNSLEIFEFRDDFESSFRNRNVNGKK